MEAEASGSEREEAPHDDIEQHAPGGRRAGPSAGSAAANGHIQEGEDNADPDVAVRHTPCSSCAPSSYFHKKQEVSCDHVTLPDMTADSQSMLLIGPGFAHARDLRSQMMCCRRIGTANGKTGSMRRSDRTMTWTWRERTRKQGTPHPAQQGIETSSCIIPAWQNLHLPDSMQKQHNLWCLNDAPAGKDVCSLRWDGAGRPGGSAGVGGQRSLATPEKALKGMLDKTGLGSDSEAEAGSNEAAEDDDDEDDDEPDLDALATRLSAKVGWLHLKLLPAGVG